MNGPEHDEAVSPRLGTIIAAAIARQPVHVQDQLLAALGEPGAVTLKAAPVEDRDYLIVRVDGKQIAVVPRHVLEGPPLDEGGIL